MFLVHEVVARSLHQVVSKTEIEVQTSTAGYAKGEWKTSCSRSQRELLIEEKKASDKPKLTTKNNNS
jgi:hypothetical protein